MYKQLYACGAVLSFFRGGDRAKGGEGTAARNCFILPLPFGSRSSVLETVDGETGDSSTLRCDDDRCSWEMLARIDLAVNLWLESSCFGGMVSSSMQPSSLRITTAMFGRSLISPAQQSSMRQARSRGQ